MIHDEQEIRQLIKRFIDGATSNAEEQTLYDYFRGDVADDLKVYQEMFQWYADGMPEQRRSHRMWKRLAVAAALVGVLAGGVAYYEQQRMDDLLLRYEGSYIVRNGEKITDLKRILPELQRTEAEAERKMLHIEQLQEGKQPAVEELPII